MSQAHLSSCSVIKDVKVSNVYVDLSRTLRKKGLDAHHPVMDLNTSVSSRYRLRVCREHW